MLSLDSKQKDLSYLSSSQLSGQRNKWLQIPTGTVQTQNIQVRGSQLQIYPDSLSFNKQIWMYQYKEKDNSLFLGIFFLVYKQSETCGNSLQNGKGQGTYLHWAPTKCQMGHVKDTAQAFLGLCSLHCVGTSNCNVNFQYLSSSVFPYVEEDLYSWMVRLAIKSILCFLSKFAVLSEELFKWLILQLHFKTVISSLLKL